MHPVYLIFTIKSIKDLKPAPELSGTKFNILTACNKFQDQHHFTGNFTVCIRILVELSSIE